MSDKGIRFILEVENNSLPVQKKTTFISKNRYRRHLPNYMYFELDNKIFLPYDVDRYIVGHLNSNSCLQIHSAVYFLKHVSNNNNN